MIYPSSISAAHKNTKLDRIQCALGRGDIVSKANIIAVIKSLFVLLVLLSQVNSVIAAPKGILLVRFDISRQSAGDSLPAFGQQANITVVYPFEDAKKHVTNRLYGSYTLKEGINILIKGSGLNAEFSADGHLIISSDDIYGESMKSPKKNILSAVVGFFVGAGGGQQVLAQGQPVSKQESIGIEEVVVTAQRKSESLQDVPIAINALSGASLDNDAPFDNVDLASSVSNFNVRNAGRPVANVFIRGVGNSDFNQNTAASVGTYVDEVFIASTMAQNVPIYDLERVEVLKGPQGTLYGANTSGGALNYISKKPEVTGDVNGSFSISYGNFNERVMQGAFGSPLIEDKLGIRVAAISTDRDGTYYNTATNSRISNRNEFGGRIQLLYTPNDQLDVLASLSTRQRDADLGTGTFRPLIDITGIYGDAGADRSDLYEVPGAPLQIEGLTNAFGAVDPSSDPFVNSSDYTGQHDRIDDVISSLRADYYMEGFTLTSISAFVDEHATLGQDADFSPVKIINLQLRHNDKQFSQELRLTTDLDGPFSAVIGAYYLHREIDVHNNFDFISLFNIQQRYTEESDSYAAFGQMTYDLSDRLSLTAGIRYTVDEKTFDQANDAVSGTITDPGEVLIPIFATDSVLNNEDKVVSGRLAVDYRMTDDAMVYASFSRGFRAGGITGGELFTDELLLPYEPEIITAYEVGAKTSWFDKRLSVNLATFYYDYKDLQVFLFRPTFVDSLGIPGTIQQTTNAASAEVYGMELELNALVGDGLQLNAGIGYVHTEYQDFVDPLTNDDLSGNELVNAPNWDVNVGFVYTKSMGRDAELELRGKASYLSEHYTDQSNLQAFRIKSNTQVDLAAAIVKDIGDNRVRFELWGRNVFDKVVPTDIVPVRGFGYDLIWFKDPATYGLKVALDF